MQNVLTVEGLCRTYSGAGHEVRALDDVSFDVARGTFVTIMGASGSGKSTLLHAIGALDPPSGGSVSILGTRIDGLSDRRRTLFRRAHIGVVFQSFNLLPTLTAEENVALPLLIGGERTRVARESAPTPRNGMGLSDRRLHRPDALSGGEQQRVAVARALINDPAILLADEPTGNLDSTHAAEIWRLLRQLAKERHCTIIAVTHEPFGASHSDRILILRDGRLVGEIEPGENDDATVVAARYHELAG